MITAYKQKVTVRPDGGIEVRVPTLKPGARAEVIVLVTSPKHEVADTRSLDTAGDLLASGLMGLCAGRQELGDSLEYARRLRRTAEQRGVR
jgi:hypothetical protein